MKLTQFKFKLPEALVALEPPFRAFPNPDGTVDKLYHRDECRLMVAHRKSQTIEMCKRDAAGNDMKDADGNPVYLGFRDIVNYFDEGDTFIFNDTKVFPARLYGTKDMGQITGWITSLEMLGYALGTIMSGMVFDMFLSFIPMWIISIVGAVVMLVLLMAAAPSARRLVDRLRAEGASA